MAVFERKYRRYEGRRSSQATRFTVLPRYAFKDVFKSKWMVAFFVICFIFPIGCCAWIYVVNNSLFQQLAPNLGEASEVFAVDSGFFELFLNIQGLFALVLTLFLGPGLVSRDLANNGLALYLSRPFSRTEYVLGKLSVMAVLLSAITWVVGLLLIALQANFRGWEWLSDNLRLALGLFVGSWVLILLLSLLALSVSAWVRWRPVAAFSILVIVLGGAFFSAMVNGLFRTSIGSLMNPTVVMQTIWSGLLGTESSSGLSLIAAWISLTLALGVCLLLINRKLRAYQVVA